jgi:hypothetical protein
MNLFGGLDRCYLPGKSQAGWSNPGYPGADTDYASYHIGKSNADSSIKHG